MAEIHWIVEPFRYYCQRNHMETFTSDDLWAYIQTRCTNLAKWINEEPGHRNIIGKIIGDIVRHGLATEVARRPSTRPSAKTRRIGVYRWNPTSS